MIKKPEWLKVPYFDGPDKIFVENILKRLGLNTVCSEADCPNRAECFSRKTATFMILGTICTRNCRFCNVSGGTPSAADETEPVKIAEAVKELGLKYVVITSVTRDDLPDGGAGHFADVIRNIGNKTRQCLTEVLIPDFKGDISALKTVADSSPAVIGHNMETVKSLYDKVRAKSDYKRSLNVLRNIRLLRPDIHSKSGIMLGLGETHDEILELFDDLLETGCEFLTIGQYLSPSKKHLPVREYIEPEIFAQYGETARKKGFKYVVSAPFVRSSYQAEKALQILGNS